LTIGCRETKDNAKVKTTINHDGEAKKGGKLATTNVGCDTDVVGLRKIIVRQGPVEIA
jgi:hypothetical protein